MLRNLFTLLLIAFFGGTLAAQITPLGTTDSGTPTCTNGNYETFSYTEDFESGSGFATGTGTASHMSNSLGLVYEYYGSDINIAGGGGVLTFNEQDASDAIPDTVFLIFDQPMTNPVLDFGGFENTSNILFTDCAGTAVNTIRLSGGFTYNAPVWETSTPSGDIQIEGTHDCIRLIVNGDFPDAWSLDVETCIPDAPNIPVPDCATCPAGSDYEYVSINGSGELELNNQVIGDMVLLFEDLDVRIDSFGTQFGGFDNDGGTMLMRLDFCVPINIIQLDIRNLEVESEVSVGTSASTMGSDAVLGGLMLTQCGNIPANNRMGVDPPGNLVKTDGPGCGANPNGEYTLDASSVSTLYFKYVNPVGGCSFDYVGFRLGTCVSNAMGTAIARCPLTVLQNNNTMALVVRDVAGNYFDYNTFNLDTTNAQNLLVVNPCDGYTEICGGPDASLDTQGVCSFCPTTSTAGPDPATIPTMGEWGLIILSILLMIIGVAGVTQRRHQTR